MLKYHQVRHYGHIAMEFNSKFNIFSFRKMHLTCHVQNVSHFHMPQCVYVVAGLDIFSPFSRYFNRNAHNMTLGTRAIEIHSCRWTSENGRMEYHATSIKSRKEILRWRRNERDGVSNHQPHDCLLNRLFRRSWKKTSKLRVTGLGAGNSPVTGEFPAQRASNAENVSIWWRYHETWRNKMGIRKNYTFIYTPCFYILLDIPHHEC